MNEDAKGAASQECLDDASVPVPSLALRAAQRYVALLNSKRYGEIESLFADAAVFYPPSGGTLRGRLAISAFYPSVIAKLSPDEVLMQRCVSEGDMCAVELAARYDRSDGTSEVHVAFDFITTDPSGMIIEMAVYPRSYTHV